MARKPFLAAGLAAAVLACASVASAGQAPEPADAAATVISAEVPATISVAVGSDGTVRNAAGNIGLWVSTKTVDGVPTTTVIPAPGVITTP